MSRNPVGVDLAATIVQEQPAGAVSMRTWVISAVNAGPPKSLDLTVTAGGKIAGAGVRYADSITTPTVGDVVVVLVTQSGGSGRGGGRQHGGAPFVIARIAV
ncbi:hypothetical protein MXD62_19925 [Frankia sp. Mgl5]|uniref:hypothetical protein n=1 Tax=Frankia sp. Mgl5 TaxID=2933793 RepID=UPI00200DC5BA|nr:hypothetical protein [Frankia sp. Mgl5]MCK9929420.1 hypothetical protein [Frankia sp. Mgl5]